MSDKELKPNEKLVKYLEIFLPRESDNANDELEVRFGTKKPITEIQFDSVIAKLKSLGFVLIDKIEVILCFLEFEIKLTIFLDNFSKFRWQCESII